MLQTIITHECGGCGSEEIVKGMITKGHKNIIIKRVAARSRKGRVGAGQFAREITVSY
jgi:hypothetical protein